MKRREFLESAGAAVLGLALGCGRRQSVDDFLEERMATLHIPGLSGLLIREGEVAWSKSYGFADLDQKIPMSLGAIQNIASISKTVTATALMQLWEKGSFDLDDAVDDYLTFPVRNPAHRDDPITFRQLLTHVSSIADGTVYSRHYRCGDPTISLGDWIEGYFTPGGEFYDAAENFHQWRPGERYSYNNVAFGLLGRLVEAMSGQSFPEFCAAGIFEPLGMRETSWYLSGIDTSKHAVPYTWVENGEPRGPTWGGEAQGIIGGGSSGAQASTRDGFVANCLYNHPNYPDGFLRTSALQLGSYLSAYLGGGPPLLQPETVDLMLQVHSEEIWGLCWYRREVEGRSFWSHGGADPGVNTRIDLNREDGVGAIVFVNTFMDSGATEMRELNDRVLAQAYL